MSPVYAVPSYPKEVELSDGSTITLRPMLREDEVALLEIFRKIPEADRFYLKDDVTSGDVIRSWAENLDYDRALPLLVIKEGKVIADGALHRQRAGARRHVGEVRIVVDPSHRNVGLGRTVMRELIAVARERPEETPV